MSAQVEELIDYGFIEGDVVSHVKDSEEQGVVVAIDSAYDLGGVTTCRVVWGVTTLEEARKVPTQDQDVQWTNKLYRVT